MHPDDAPRKPKKGRAAASARKILVFNKVIQNLKRPWVIYRFVVSCNKKFKSTLTVTAGGLGYSFITLEADCNKPLVTMTWRVELFVCPRDSITTLPSYSEVLLSNEGTLHQ